MAASKKLISSTFIETIYKSRLVLIDYLKKEKYDCEDYDEFSISEISAMVANNQLDLLEAQILDLEEKIIITLARYAKKQKK